MSQRRLLRGASIMFDPVFTLLIVVTGLLALAAQIRVKSAFARWGQVNTKRGLMGADVARHILDVAGIKGVKIERATGFLTDHYDPGERTLRLSPQVYESRSVAAAGVAAHEVGHALQHAQGYGPLKVRSWLAPAASFGSNLGVVIIILGLALGAIGLAKLGVGVFAAMVAFVLVTLPVEFDASRRARQLLEAAGLTRGEEVSGVADVLNAAALTYVAAAISAVAQLIYWGVLLSRSQRN